MLNLRKINNMCSYVRMKNLLNGTETTYVCMFNRRNLLKFERPICKRFLLGRVLLKVYLFASKKNYVWILDLPPKKKTL